MKKGLWIILILLLPFPFVVQATLYQGHMLVNGTAMDGYEIIARTCKDLSCVKQNIQLIDIQISDLIARRLAFVRRGGELKNSAVVPDNEHLSANVITNVTRQAQYQGYPPEIAQSVFKELDLQSQAYENKFHGTVVPRVSPGSSSIPTPNVNDPRMVPTITPGANDAGQ